MVVRRQPLAGWSPRDAGTGLLPRSSRRPIHASALPAGPRRSAGRRYFARIGVRGRGGARPLPVRVLAPFVTALALGACAGLPAASRAAQGSHGKLPPDVELITPAALPTSMGLGHNKLTIPEHGLNLTLTLQSVRTTRRMAPLPGRSRRRRSQTAAELRQTEQLLSELPHRVQLTQILRYRVHVAGLVHLTLTRSRLLLAEVAAGHRGYEVRLFLLSNTPEGPRSAYAPCSSRARRLHPTGRTSGLPSPARTARLSFPHDEPGVPAPTDHNGPSHRSPRRLPVAFYGYSRRRRCVLANRDSIAARLQRRILGWRRSRGRHDDGPCNWRRANKALRFGPRPSSHQHVLFCGDDYTGAPSAATPVQSVTTLPYTSGGATTIEAAWSTLVADPTTGNPDAVIYGMNSDGSDPTIVAQLPSDSSGAGPLAVSPDGTEVAYVTDNGSTDSSVWSQPVSGGPPREIYGPDLPGYSANNPPLSPSFSPDGTHVLLSTGINNPDGSFKTWALRWRQTRTAAARRTPQSRCPRTCSDSLTLRIRQTATKWRLRVSTSPAAGSRWRWEISLAPT